MDNVSRSIVSQMNREIHAIVERSRCYHHAISLITILKRNIVKSARTRAPRANKRIFSLDPLGSLPFPNDLFRVSILQGRGVRTTLDLSS